MVDTAQIKTQLRKMAVLEIENVHGSGSEAVMLELVKEGWEWIKSERFHKQEEDKAKKREANNPMKSCVLKFDHFEKKHRCSQKKKGDRVQETSWLLNGILLLRCSQRTKNVPVLRCSQKTKELSYS